MPQVIRYFHLRPQIGLRGGATIRVAGDTERVGQVDIQIAICSRKDAFVKAVGRYVADYAPVKVVALRYLPREMEAVATQVLGYPVGFDFAIKYFLSKE